MKVPILSVPEQKVSMDNGSLDALDVWVTLPRTPWLDTKQQKMVRRQQLECSQRRKADLTGRQLVFVFSVLVTRKKRKEGRNKETHFWAILMSWELFIPAKSSSFWSFSLHIQDWLWIKAKVNDLEFSRSSLSKVCKFGKHPVTTLDEPLETLMGPEEP